MGSPSLRYKSLGISGAQGSPAPRPSLSYSCPRFIIFLIFRGDRSPKGMVRPREKRVASRKIIKRDIRTESNMFSLKSYPIHAIIWSVEATSLVRFSPQPVLFATCCEDDISFFEDLLICLGSHASRGFSEATHTPHNFCMIGSLPISY